VNRDELGSTPAYHSLTKKGVILNVY